MTANTRVRTAIIAAILCGCSPAAPIQLYTFGRSASECVRLEATLAAAAETWRDGFGVEFSRQGCTISQHAAELVPPLQGGWMDEVPRARDVAIAVVDLIEGPGGVEMGGARFGWHCDAQIALELEVLDRPRLVAHELGHLFALGHRDDPENLMDQYEIDGDWTLDDEQLDALETSVSAWEDCRR